MTPMRIILGVTGAALGRQMNLTRRLDMATLAFDARVATLQRETGHLVVVKMRQLPARLVVARLAFGSIATFVAIVLRMTAVAFHGRLCHPRWLDMARCAACFTMGPAERKVSLPLVIKHDLLPHLAGMALNAFRAVLSFVNVILAMAIDTGRRRVAIDLVHTMARSTRCRSMRAK